MKTMTCKQLGGACDTEFTANTFEEMAELSKQHSMEMFQKDDEDHLKAKDEMMQLMKSPDAMQHWLKTNVENLMLYLKTTKYFIDFLKKVDNYCLNFLISF